MSNLFHNKQNSLNYKSFIARDFIDKSTKIQSNSEINEYKNTIYYPLANKEWFTSIYSYNKSYIKSLNSLVLTDPDNKKN